MNANMKTKPVSCSFLTPKQTPKYDAGKVQTERISGDSDTDVLRLTFNRMLRYIV